MHSKRWGTWLLAASATILAGCEPLSEIERDTCGNGIVEHGEDCDTFPKEACGAVGTPQQCRFVCDQTKAQTGCPTGWACGADAMCREPSASFASPTHPFDGPLLRAYAGDFDGDKHPDVLALGGDELHALYFDLADPFRFAQSLRPASPPCAGALTSSGISDLVMLAQGGINVMRGTEDRRFLPTPYSAMPVPDSGKLAMKFAALDAMVPGSMEDWMAYAGDELVVFLGPTLFVPGAATADQQQVVLSETLPGVADNLLGEVQIANLWEGIESPCEELVFTYTGSSQVQIVTPCRRVGQTYLWNQHLATKLPPVVLPQGPILTGVMVADLNGDGAPDLLVDDGNGNLHAAFNAGQGRFHSDPAHLSDEGLVPDQKFGPVQLLVGEYPMPVGLPLAVADLNGDHVADLVVGGWMGTILVSVPSAQPGTWSYFPTVFQHANVWAKAIIQDFNGNKIPDILASTGKTPDFDFFNGVGNGVFNYFTVRTAGVPRDFRVGDFDGDLIADVVFSEQLPGGGDNLAVAFGQSFGAPAAPTSIGRLGTVSELLPMDLTGFGLDAITDLIVITSSKDKEGNALRSIGIFGGSSDRQLQSPLRLSLDANREAIAISVGLGQFDGDAAGHLDLAAIGQDSYDATNPGMQQGYSMWLVPSTGEAEVDATRPSKSEPLPSEFAIHDGLMAAVNLDADGGDDELVMLAAYWGMADPQSAPSQQGALAIARASQVGDRRTFVLQGNLQPTRLSWHSPQYGGMWGGDAPAVPGDKGGEVSSSPMGSEDMIGNPGGQIRVVDVDGDQLRDVVATGNFIDYQAADMAEKRFIHIFRNTGVGSLSAADALEIPSPGAELIQGFTFLQADTDPELELVVVTRREAWLVQIDLKARSVGAATRLAGVKGGFDALAQDFDGDGLHDLVVVGEAGLFFHAGTAVKR